MVAAIFNLKIDPGTLKLVIWCAVAGVVLCLVIAFLNKALAGSIITALLNEESLSPDTAKSLTELNVAENSSAFWFLRHSSSVQRIVKIPEGELYKTLSPESKLYIDPEMKPRAEQQYVLKKYEIVAVVVGVIVVIGIGAIANALLL